MSCDHVIYRFSQGCSTLCVPVRFSYHKYQYRILRTVQYGSLANDRDEGNISLSGYGLTNVYRLARRLVQNACRRIDLLGNGEARISVSDAERWPKRVPFCATYAISELITITHTVLRRGSC